MKNKIENRNNKINALDGLKAAVGAERISLSNHSRFIHHLFLVVESVAECLEYIDALESGEVDGIKGAAKASETIVKVAELLTENIDMEALNGNAN